MKRTTLACFFKENLNDIIVYLCIIMILSLINNANNLLFVSIVEFFSIFVALGIFIITWNSRQIALNKYLLLIGVSLLLLGFIDILNLTSDLNRNLYLRNGNSDLELEILVRAFLGAFLFVIPWIYRRTLTISRLVIVALSLLVIVALAFYVKGLEVNRPKLITSFEILLVSQCLIMGALSYTSYRLLKERQQYEPNFLKVVFLTSVLNIFESSSVIINNGLLATIRFYLEFITCYLLYKTIININLLEPIRDLTQSKAELASSKSKFKAIFEGVAIGIGLYDLEQDCYIEANPVLLEILKCDREDIVGKKMGSFTYNQADWETDYNCFQQLLAGAIDKYQLEKQYRLKNGNIRWGRLTVSLLYDEGGAPRYAVRTTEDISRQKNLESQLADESERLVVTLRSLAEGVIATNTKGQIVLLNRAAEEITGWEQADAVGKSLYEILYLQSKKGSRLEEGWIEKTLAEPSSFDAVLVDKYLTQRLVELNAAPISRDKGNNIGIVFILRDVTQKRRLDEEQLKMAKLESIGVLAGGIAHDFNNILAEVLANSQLIKMKLERGKDVSQNFEEVQSSVKKATALTKQLLTFAKGGTPIKQTAAIAEVIVDSVDLTLGGTDIKPSYALPNDLWPVSIDIGQISQVITNIVNNSSQAMPDGGNIRISGENLLVEGGNYSELKTGRYVKITIRDEGDGIPDDIIGKVFDPYFSTKSRNGLGLTTSFAIINQHNGHIEVKSKLGRGTSITIFLPALNEPINKQTLNKNRTGTKRGSRILLMDDDLVLGDLVGQMLVTAGFEVRIARDGKEAIEIYQVELVGKNRIDAVIMDLTVPGGMGGKETIAELLKIDPEVRAIISSGYSNDPVMSEYQLYGFRGVVKKPYDFTELINLLDNILEPADKVG